MIIIDKPHLKQFKAYTRELFNEWLGVKISSRWHRELLASLTLSKSDAHLCARLKDGPVALATNFNDTQFEEIFSNAYKIPLSDDAFSALSSFLEANVIDLAPVPGISFAEFGTEINLKRALEESLSYNAAQRNILLKDTDTFSPNDLRLFPHIGEFKISEIEDVSQEIIRDLHINSDSTDTFDNWVVKNTILLSKVKEKLCYIAQQYELINYLENGANLEYSVLAIKNIKFPEIKKELSDSFSEKGLLVTWRLWELDTACWDTEVPFNTSYVTNNSHLAKQRVYMSVFDQGEWHPVGIANAMTIHINRHFSSMCYENDYIFCEIDETLLAYIDNNYENLDDFIESHYHGSALTVVNDVKYTQNLSSLRLLLTMKLGESTTPAGWPTSDRSKEVIFFHASMNGLPYFPQATILIIDPVGKQLTSLNKEMLKDVHSDFKFQDKLDELLPGTDIIPMEQGLKHYPGHQF